MPKGFSPSTKENQKTRTKNSSKEPSGRLISWSPWPPANFQTRYPAFPFVLTVIICVIGQIYLSTSK